MLPGARAPSQDVGQVSLSPPSTRIGDAAQDRLKLLMLIRHIEVGDSLLDGRCLRLAVFAGPTRFHWPTTQVGADVAVATAAMIAVGCQQYRICDMDKCPVGIATQDPALRARLDVEKSATRVANFFRVCTEELKEFARLTGNDDVHGLSLSDLCTTNSEISNHVNIEHV